MAIPGMGFFGRVYTRDEVNNDVMWLVYFYSALFMQGGLIWLVASIDNEGLPVSWMLMGFGAAFLALGKLTNLWCRFAALCLCEALLVGDLAMRHNFFGLPFIFLNAIMIYKMFKYRNMMQGKGGVALGGLS